MVSSVKFDEKFIKITGVIIKAQKLSYIYQAKTPLLSVLGVLFIQELSIPKYSHIIAHEHV